MTWLMIAWVLYFMLHSLMASDNTKRWCNNRFPNAAPYYRIFYNGVAIITLLPIAILIATHKASPYIIWPETLFWLKAIVVTLAVSCFIWSLKYYDLKAFMGTSRETHQADQSPLVISPLHRYVRHPWYSCALFILWFRDMDTAQFISTLMISGYFVIGGYLEERRLVKAFGESYQYYQRKVPALIPLPWKRLTNEEALTITARASKRD